MDWDAAAMLEAIDMERRGVLTDGGDILQRSHEEIAREKFTNSVALAVGRIVHIACYSENESRALSAATYIVDRVFGKTTDIPLGSGADEDSLEKMLTSAFGGV